MVFMKIASLFSSRRFWLAVAGMVAVVADTFGLPVSQANIQEIVLLAAAWIVGDSLRKTE